jgi:peptidoglycan/xylan/chitin deacetylase (PgdA/CDA1 family)
VNTKRVAASVTACAIAGRIVPLALWLRPVRTSVWPELAGIGRSTHVALTFDDGPDPRSTPRILEELHRLDVRATFFLLGSMTRLHPETARLVADAGHEIAVHGSVHRNHQYRSSIDVYRDMRAARDRIADVTGALPRWFRPPYGALTWSTLHAARDLGLYTVLWTTWGRDWRQCADTRSVVHDVTRHLAPGGTILLHDSDCTSSPNSWRSTHTALEPIVDEVRARRLELGPLRDHGIATAMRTPHWLNVFAQPGGYSLGLTSNHR